MKHIMLAVVLVLLATTAVMSQKVQRELSISGGQFSLVYGTAQQSENGSVPLIEGRALAGSKEHFGILLKSSSSPFIEVVDANGKALKTISVGEFLGKNTKEGVKLVSSRVNPDEHSAESICDFELSSGHAQLITSALLAGDKNNARTPEQLVVTFSLKAEGSSNLSLRLLLPFEGTGEAVQNGAILLGKSSPSAVALTVSPSAATVSIQKNVLSVKSPVLSVAGRTPMVWISARGANEATQAASKSLAADIIAATAKTPGDPNIVVVNTVSKTNAQPGDTVTYTLTCKNIGSGDATNVILTNPVPNGTSYLEGSVEGNGTETSLDREAATAPQSGAVTMLRWKLKEALRAGREQVVSFKVVVL